MTSIKKIGLFGFGTVGQGFYEALKKYPQLPVEISKVCVRRLDLPRIGHELYFTTEADELLNDPEISIIIEVIDDAFAAKKIVEKALMNEKHVISANKKMISDSLPDIDLWHQTFNCGLLYEAAVGGGIPIVYNVDELFRDQEVTGIRGILNGSSNYILTQMQQNQWSFERALKEAQGKGFAESNPILDISGVDASNKLSILSYHAFGRVLNMQSCELTSIEEISLADIKKARNQGKKVKPIASVIKNGDLIQCSVKPEKVGPNDPLYSVDNENNVITIDTVLSGRHVAVGKGAGALPTGSAVLEDLKRVLSGFKYRAGRLRKEVA